MLNRNMKFDFSEVSPRQVIANIINSTGEDLKKEVAAYLKIPEFALTIKKLDWLGLFDDKKLDIGTCSVFEMFAHTVMSPPSAAATGVAWLQLMSLPFAITYPPDVTVKFFVALNTMFRELFSPSNSRFSVPLTVISARLSVLPRT